MQLSSGPWSYNRFDAYEKSLTEGSKPDYLDFDKDGDKKEPMKKALKEKGKKEVKEGNLPPWLKDKKDDKKESCDDCKKAGKKDCDCDDKKEVKEGAGLAAKAAMALLASKGKKSKEVKEAIINSLMGDGLANNPVSAEIIAEHMSDEWAELILSEKISDEEREKRRKDKEYERRGESKEKSDDIKAAEERQAKKDKTLGKTKQVRRADKPGARWGIRRKMANPMAQKPGDTGAENPGGKPVQG